MMVMIVVIEMYVGDRFDRFININFVANIILSPKNDLPFVHIISEYKQVTTKPVK